MELWVVIVVVVAVALVAAAAVVVVLKATAAPPFVMPKALYLANQSVGVVSRTDLPLLETPAQLLRWDYTDAAVPDSVRSQFSVFSVYVIQGAAPELGKDLLFPVVAEGTASTLRVRILSDKPHSWTSVLIAPNGAVVNAAGSDHPLLEVKMTL